MADVSRKSLSTPSPVRPSTTTTKDPLPPSKLRDDTLPNAPSTVHEDDEDDSSEEESEDEVHPKVAAVSRWTLEEQAAVMNFYNLSTLYPQFWNEDQPAGVIKSPSVASSFVAPESPPPPTMQPEPALDLSDPLGIKESIYGRGKRRLNLTSETSQISHLLITSKIFSPTLFLREVHRTTSYRDFELGAERLQSSIEDRMEVIKNLVKTHFAKFVNAKSTIDSFYNEMRRQNLISNEDYGITPFANSIDELCRNAPNLYAPMLERRQKAEKIRITLSILEQWKFFFNLPSVLQEYIRKQTYDAAVRDYKKGKYLMQTSFSSTSTAPSTVPPIITTREKDNTLLPQHHRKVFEKVWVEVERIVKGLRDRLFRGLKDVGVSVEVQERHIMYLIDLDSETDPVWFYLENQYKWICKQLTEVYTSHLDRMHVLQEAAATHIPADTLPPSDEDDIIEEEAEEDEERKEEEITPVVGWMGTKVVVRRSRALGLESFRRAVAAVRGRRFEKVFADDLDVQLWKATIKLARVVCDILVECLPDFWKLCRIFSEGRFQKQQQTQRQSEDPTQPAPKKRADAKKLEQCQGMVKSIVDLYSTILGNAFFLEKGLGDLPSDARGDVTVSEPPKPNEDTGLVVVEGGRVVVSPSGSIGEDLPALTVLEPTATAASQQQQQQQPEVPLEALPIQFATFLRAHPLTTCYFVAKCSAVLSKCLAEVRGMRLSGTGGAVMIRLSEVLEKIRARGVEGICEGVIYESSHFHTYETWHYDTHHTQSPLFHKSQSILLQDSTTLQPLFYRFLKYCLTSLHRIATTPLAHPSDFLPPSEKHTNKRLTSSNGEEAQ
ncbi:hypothetical protein HK097_000604, partial [Rhizophlyctis rosea]